MTYMTLRSVIVNERCQKQNITYCTIPNTWPSFKGKIIHTENRLVIVWDWVWKGGKTGCKGAGGNWGRVEKWSISGLRFWIHECKLLSKPTMQNA